jgi:hypothetical protein
MDYITTTELRTKTKELVNTLKDGGSVSLIHRSEIIGIFKPAPKTQQSKPFDPDKFLAAIKDIKPNPLVPRSQRDIVYRKRLEEKYGKDLH